MSKIRFHILVFLFPHSYPCVAQWEKINSGTANALYDIHFPTPLTGYAAGYSGTILKTLDEGSTWQSLSSPKNLDWQTVLFLNEDTGLVGGDSSYIYRTTDGGNSWMAVTNPKEGAMRTIHFTDDMNGFAGGGFFGSPVILKTTDGGISWVPTAIDSTADRPITSLYFPTDDTGYATVYGYSDYFLKTTDGGNNWTYMPIQLPNFLSNLEDVHFTDANTGFMGGWYNAALIRTNDGGISWEYPDSLNSPQLYSLHFTHKDTGYASGWYGTILETTDGGNTWNAVPSNAANHILYSIFFSEEGTGFAVGDSGYILKSRNEAGSNIKTVNYTDNSNSLVIYPNPNQGTFVVRMADYSELTIYNVFGGIVYRQSEINNPLSEIDLKKYGSGIYYVQVISEKGMITKKVSIE